jgi:3-hydroxyisobutyrate dehydrogenase
MKIAFLGTGLMGTGFVRGLLARGHEITVWNRTRDKTQAVASAGARVAASPAAAAAGAERLYLALSDDAAVDAVLADALGALSAGVPVVDFTTTAPVPTRARAERLRAAGRAFLHAPVFMSPENARLAQGLMLSSGPEAVHAALADELGKMTGALWYLGPEPARAATLKLCGNGMFFSIVAGLADVLTMARAAGVGASEVMELFGKLDPSIQIRFRGAKMARRDFSASFELSMARKDTRLMLETAADAAKTGNSPPPPLAILPAIAARMDALIASGHAQDDLGVLAWDAVL